jgi:hypothetical protein
MSTPERTSRGGRDDDFDGVDAFGLDPADGDEEIFEWIGGDEEDEASPDRLPRMSFRDALRQLRANRRAVTRRAVVLLTTTAVVAGAAIGFTSWFDAVSRAADNAAVANVALDSVVDGDPAVAKFDAKTTNGTQQFVLEVANNGPDTVTLLGVSIDAGSLMTSKLWKPMGSPAIPAGGTGLVAVTVDLNCDLVMVSQSLGRGSVSFPNVDVTVRTGNGDVRKTTLRTRSDVTRAVGAVTQQDGTITTDPQIVMGGERGCLQMIEQRGADQGNRSLSP